MPITVGTGPPTVAEAGNNYSFTETFTDFPSTNWSMQLVMQIPGNGIAPNVFNAANNASTSFIVNVSGLTNPGRYSWAEYVTEFSSGARETAKTGVLELIPNLSTQAQPSAAQTMLANIEAAITKLTVGGFQSVSVNNVSYSRYDIATLISMRTRLQAEVIRERQKADARRGIETSGRIDSRFVPTLGGRPFWSKEIGEE
jgi:hypothetical protein